MVSKSNVDSKSGRLKLSILGPMGVLPEI